jgi:hypothetical protein
LHAETGERALAGRALAPKKEMTTMSSVRNFVTMSAALKLVRSASEQVGMLGALALAKSVSCEV